MVLLINGREAVTSPKGIDIDALLQNADNKTAAGGAFSYALELPYCPENAEIFGHAHDIGIKGAFLTRYSAALSHSGIMLLEGSFKLLSAGQQGFSGELYSSSMAWAEQLAGKSLRDLQSLPQAPFNGMADADYNIEWYRSRDSSEVDVQFPLLAYGNFPNPAYTAPARMDVIPGLSLNLLPPAVYLRSVVKAVFKDIGWELSGSILNDSLFKSLVIPYTGTGDAALNTGTLAVASAENNNGAFTYSQAMQCITEYNTFGSENPLGLVYTVPYPGYYNITARAEVSVPGTVVTLPYYFAAEVYSAFYEGLTYAQTRTGSVPGAGSDSLSADLPAGYYLNAGDKVLVYLLSSPINAAEFSYIISLSAEALVSDSMPLLLNLAANLPDIQQADVVKAVLRMFGQKLLPDFRTRQMCLVGAPEPIGTPVTEIDKGRVLPGSMVCKPLPLPARRRFCYSPDLADGLLRQNPRFADAEILNPLGEPGKTEETGIVFSPSLLRPFVKAGLTTPMLLANIADKAAMETAPDRIVPEFNRAARLLCFQPYAGGVAGELFTVEGKSTCLGGALHYTDTIVWTYLLPNYYPKFAQSGTMAELKVKLKPEEFAALMNGSPVEIGDEILDVLSVSGYNPAAGSPANLVLLKQDYF